MNGWAFAWKGLGGSAVLAAGFVLFSVPPLDRPAGGTRGAARRRALESSALFAAVELPVRQIAAWVRASRVPLPRRLLEAMQRRSGDWLGLCPEEVVALSGVCATTGGLLGWVVCNALLASPMFVVVGPATGASVPFLRMSGARATRGREATRSLPAAIDLLWLCMSAGLDFPGALRFATEDHAIGGVLRQELQGFLREIEIGHTRAEALRALERRLPVPAIQSFVGAVTQAEARGNPLSEVLRVQAQVLRAQRGVQAEEAAARAAVLLVVPLMLLLGCVLLLLCGPVLLAQGLPQ